LKTLPLWLLVVILAGVGVTYFYMTQRNDGEKSGTPVVVIPEAPLGVINGPKINHPIEEVQAIPDPVVEPEPLPALYDSDPVIAGLLTNFFGSEALEQIFHLKYIVPLIVATVDNLPREQLALKIIPVKPAAGKFRTIGEAESLSIGPDNYSRYVRYITLAKAVDSEALVAAYVQYYPLFQEAFQELGYPSRYFNDRLVEVIDHLLATPDIDEPILLHKPKVVYQYSDPQLELLSAGQKIMLRIGSDNAVIIKQKLAEIRQAVSNPG
jgi:hypothetical protein